MPALLAACLLVPAADGLPPQVRTTLARHCADCHGGGVAEGGLDLDALSDDLADAAAFARWERVFDRIHAGEMPPEDADRPDDAEREAMLAPLRIALADAHAATRGTVLRRLNRREYQNTLNDLFGTDLPLADMLPEDGRAGGFDTVGGALGVSLVHLQNYIDAAGAVLDAAVADTAERPEPDRIVGSWLGTREGDQFIGTVWKRLPDDAVVRFSGGGYPTGMMRSTSVRRPGRYRVTVAGYAYQSDGPITFSVEGTSFARGSDKPVHGFFSFPPGQPGAPPSETAFETRIDEGSMIAIEPYGIADPRRYQRRKDGESIDEYDGPGLAIQSVTLEGPLLDQWPSRGHELLFDGLDRREIPVDAQTRGKSWYKPRFEIHADDAAAAAVLRRVATAAFRRPTEDVMSYAELFAAQRTDGATFGEALRTAVTAVLCSPRFLYLHEPPGRLDDHALAARLSYFLVRTTPDDELLRLAAEGRLGDPEVLREQTDRLLGDPRFSRFVTDFTDNWLDLRELEATAPDEKLFPEFDDYLRWSMPRETRAFVAEMFAGDRPVTDLVRPGFAMLNARLAELYDLSPVTGAEIRPVPLPADSVRGGLLAQAAVLKVTANGTNTSPVTRGAWVMDRILGQVPPPPPPGIPGVEPDVRGAVTLRQLLAQHRDSTDCAACHRRIDPPGFALESFDPIGSFRDRYRSLGDGERVDRRILGRRVQYRLGQPVDASGTTPGGARFAGFRQFRDHLAADPDRLARTLAEKLLTFATGRELGFSDRPEIDRLVADSAADGHRIRQILHRVVQSETFRSK